MQNRKRKLAAAAGGVAVGLLNGLLGAGGGMVTVPMLEALGARGKKSHATSLAVILPLSLVSAGIYWYRGWLSPMDALPFLPGGLIGAFAGGWLLGRVRTGWVKLAFGILLVWAGWRMAFG